MTGHSVFADIRFWLVLLVSVVAPLAIYGLMLAKRAISRYTALLLGVTLVAIAGFDVYVLQSLATAAKLTSSLADDAIYASEMSLALYLFPAMFGGIGVNVVSHVLVRHLVEAETRFEAERRSR